MKKKQSKPTQKSRTSRRRSPDYVISDERSKKVIRKYARLVAVAGELNELFPASLLGSEAVRYYGDKYRLEVVDRIDQAAAAMHPLLGAVIVAGLKIKHCPMATPLPIGKLVASE